ncbi:MAG: holo-ACP synthase [Eggerthellaceae bacterium]|nr:holo-ACP synthase [Eggerthellaceae bacterium]
MDTIQEQQNGRDAADAKTVPAESAAPEPAGASVLAASGPAGASAPAASGTVEGRSAGDEQEKARSQADRVSDPEEDAAIPVDLEGSVGLGVDLVEIARMKRVLARTPSFARRVYTEEERAYCESMASPHVHYATRFAAKEAVLKALGTGFSFGIAPADVEVVRNQYGRPQVRLHRRAAEVAKAQGVREIPVSLSYTHSDAVACAMAITEDSVRVAEERVDPMEELAKQFKEARSMLDDLPVRDEHGQTTGTLPDLGDSEQVSPDAQGVSDLPAAEEALDLDDSVRESTDVDATSEVSDAQEG